MANIEICTLGTASGLPAHHRFGQTIILTQHTPDEGESHLILDAGDGASSLLMRHGYDHRRIRSIFISHMHADHHAGLIQLLKTCMHLEKRDELIILAPAEGIPAFKAYLDASYLFEEWLGFPIRWLPLTGLVELPGGGMLRAYPNAHLSWVSQRVTEIPRLRDRTYAAESYCAVYEFAACRVVYAGNLHGPQGSDEMAPFVEPCDLLIAELAHVDPVELGRFLAGRAIGNTVVVHFHPRWDQVADAEIRERIYAGAGEGTIRGDVSLAHDGDRFPCWTVTPHEGHTWQQHLPS
ncbi:MAG: MBL fold metallo-hydrolase [Herpetosiphonaceae bacterium]|nr:MBL fold metallo-hydrolase [Herpetosiphonaceae bacterium]